MAENEEKLDELGALKNVFCSPVKITKEGWELPTKLIAGGGDRSIAEACKEGGTECNYVMKIMNTGSVEKLQDFRKEVALQKKAASPKVGVAPPVIDH